MSAPSGPAARRLTRHPSAVSAAERSRLLRQRGGVVWLTGLSGAGKSTLATAVEAALIRAGHAACVLDGDNLRHGLNADLGFSREDRRENIRRAGEVAALFADAGLIVIAAFISPYRAGREAAREAIGAARFLEVFLDAPLAVCERRDPKGLYRRARAGEIAEFTGISAPYEPPEAPALTLDTAREELAVSARRIVELLATRGFLTGEAPPGETEVR
ncbi:MAG TPA: adenylyl-sulfate kinase [Thermoanaerobaculia bacterium]|nr:adenylyl-sulfate kinase [Thermoanaerobaculia bacterium]